MNIKAFFVDALTSALDPSSGSSIGTPDDVVRHVTPEVLATHLPRPLWARLLTACLGAPRVDAQLVVDTIGIPNLCEHVPAPIIWACIAEIGARSLGKTPDVSVAPAPLPRPSAPTGRQAVLAPPPPPAERSRPTTAPPPTSSTSPVAIGPSIPAPTPTAAVNQPLADLITELESDSSLSEPRLAKLRPRSPTAERFRQTNTGVNRLGGPRRPQASAAVPTPPQGTASARRETDGSDMDTHVGDRDKAEIGVDDSQLVDWPATDAAGAPAVTHDEDFGDVGRKR